MEEKLAAQILPVRFTRADLMMLSVAIIWGTGFPLVKAALAEIPPFAFNALRFPLAVALLFLAWKLR